MSCLATLNFRECICSSPDLGEIGGGAVCLEESKQKEWPLLHVASFTPQAIVFCPLTPTRDAKSKTSSRKEPALDLEINPENLGLSLAGWF